MRLLGLDANNLYWVSFPNTSSPSPVNGLYATSKLGGTNTSLGQTTAVTPFGSLGLDATTVYSSLNDTIVATPIGSGSSRVVTANTTTTSVAVANGNVYWVDDMGAAMNVAVAGGTPSAVVPLPSNEPGRGAFATVASSDAVYASFALAFSGSP